MNYELSSHQKFLRKLKKDFDLHIRKNWKEEYISQTVSDYVFICKRKEASAVFKIYLEIYLLFVVKCFTFVYKRCGYATIIIVCYARAVAQN